MLAAFFVSKNISKKTSRFVANPTNPFIFASVNNNKQVSTLFFMKKSNYPRPTAEMKAAAEKVLALRAVVATIKPVIEAIHDEVLAETKPVDEKGNSVTWFDLYILGEEKYLPILELNQQKILAAGFTPPEGCCPLLMAENNLRQANYEMNNLAQALLPQRLRVRIDEIWDMKGLKKLTDLNLSYIMSR